MDLDVYRDLDTGEVFVVPTDAELDAEEKLAVESFEGTMVGRRMGGEPEARADRVREMGLGQIADQYEKRRRQLVDIRPKATKERYRLVVPTHGEKLRAREQAMVTDGSGLRTIDPDVFVTKLLHAAGQGAGELSASDIDNLHPAIVAVLASRVLRAVQPDPNRLFSVASGSGST